MNKIDLVSDIFKNVIRLEPDIGLSKKNRNILMYYLERDILAIFGKTEFKIDYVSENFNLSSFDENTIYYLKNSYSEEVISQGFYYSGIKYSIEINKKRQINIYMYAPVLTDIPVKSISNDNLIASISYTENGNMSNFLAEIENAIYVGSTTQMISENGVFEIFKEEVEDGKRIDKCAKFISLNMRANGKEYVELVTASVEKSIEKSFLMRLFKLIKDGPENLIGIYIRNPECSIYESLPILFDELEKHYVNSDSLERKLINK